VGSDVAAFLEQRAALIASATPGSDAARALSDLTDRTVSGLAEAALSQLRSPWAVLALGGWGARRLLPHSDLDLLVVTDAPARELRPALTGVLYPLWDAGLTVGHQVRSRRDHERAVRDDLPTLTATLTGRVLCGNGALGQRVLASAAAGARKHSRALVRALTARERPGSPYLLEPDLKDGAGGRRDLDELTWLAAVLSGSPRSDPAALCDLGLLEASEFEALRRAGDLLDAGRWIAHRVAPRAVSTLTIEVADDPAFDAEALQGALADVHHITLRVRGRQARRPTAFDPRLGPPAAIEGPGLFALLDRGDEVLPALEEAAWAGLLDDLAPSFSELMHLRRAALSHAYTVGSHCLRCATVIGSADARPEMVRALEGVGDRRPLLAAALLHDVGKTQRGPGHPGRGDAFVRTLGARFGLTPAQVGDAALLVREHLLLAEVAAGRDIHDEDVIVRTAALVPRPDLVDALFVLTAADALATGPGAWSAWHAALVGELTDRLRAALSDPLGRAGMVERAEAVRAEAAALLSGQPSAPAAAFVARAPLRYLAASSASVVVRHAGLVAGVVENGRPDTFAVAVAAGTAQGAWRVSVAAPDRPGLFATICGALCLSGLDIHAADAWDAYAGVALDVFVVGSDTRATVDTATWASFERHLAAGLADPAGLAVRLAERRRHYPSRSRARTHVRVEETGAYATAVRVRAADRPGLLYDIARAFADTGLRLTWARAVTRSGVANDVFHVTDGAGEPVADAGVLGHLAMRIRQRV
jgi:[protein-PII] uridylyltransferase